MLEFAYVRAAHAVIAALLSFIGIHTPERTEPLTWPEVLSNVHHMAADGNRDAAMMIYVDDLRALPGGCDDWCANIALAREAAVYNEMRTVVEYAFQAYGVGYLSDWAWRTILCESGGTATANSGYYGGLSQQDPKLWPYRSAAAGFPGASMFDPVANAGTMAWMMAAGYGAGHWPLCGR